MVSERSTGRCVKKSEGQPESFRWRWYWSRYYCIYSDAGYNVGMADALVRILKGAH